MIILRSPVLPDVWVDEPVCALNSLWVGIPQPTMTLPHLGHIFLLCPLDDLQFSVNGMFVDADHYLWLTRPTTQPITLHPLSSASHARLLVLMLSPDFIADMAEFLGIPVDFSDLLHSIPLSQGDGISHLMQSLATTLHRHEESEELFFEVVGQVLQLLRLRHQTIESLAQHKRDTITDLTLRLLEARQFIESHYLEPIKTQHVADHVALSEYHFARLFKTAFEVTVHQYVMRLRLDEARRLLEASNATVTDIALAVGYNSLSAFIRAFGKTCGMSPSAYMERFRSDSN